MENIPEENIETFCWSQHFSYKPPPPIHRSQMHGSIKRKTRNRLKMPWIIFTTRCKYSRTKGEYMKQTRIFRAVRCVVFAPSLVFVCPLVITRTSYQKPSQKNNEWRTVEKARAHTHTYQYPQPLYGSQREKSCTVKVQMNRGRETQSDAMRSVLVWINGNTE